MTDLSFFWIPEHPRIPLYKAKTPTQEGKLGEVTNLLTADAWEALWFPTKEDCEAWIRDNPEPAFRAVEHGFC